MTWGRAQKSDGTHSARATPMADRDANWSAEDARAFLPRCAFAHGTGAAAHAYRFLSEADADLVGVFAEMREQWKGRRAAGGGSCCPIDMVNDETVFRAPVDIGRKARRHFWAG